MMVIDQYTSINCLCISSVLHDYSHTQVSGFRGGNVLIVDFGTLRIESELQPKDVSLEVTQYHFASYINNDITLTVS